MTYGLKIAEATVHHELILDLVGPFQLRNTQGVNLTPRSQKAQGLLALVGTSRNLRRSRTWLQDKLWSDRGREQGAASLRQCLCEIRSVLRSHATCFRTESGWISLDPDRILVNAKPAEGSGGGDAEFLEGVDVRDPEFEDWLRSQRAFYSSQNLRLSDTTPQEGLPGALGREALFAELARAYQTQAAALDRLARELEFVKAALHAGPRTNTCQSLSAVA
jgi:hypothetical protein